MQKNLYLHFNRQLVEKPIMSVLIRKYDVEVNIMQASINPNEEGSMFVQLTATPENMEKALGYLVNQGVGVTVTPERIVWLEEKCVHCGACVGQCITKALEVDAETRQTVFLQERCIACELCIPACPYHAIEKSSSNGQ